MVAGEPAPDTPYDLYGTDTNARGTIPFPVTFPTAPSGLTPFSVTNNAQLATALATTGLDVTVAAGSYNTLALTQTNQNWTLDNNAVFAGLTGNSFSRIEVTGGRFSTAADVSLYDFEDFTLRNANIACDDMLLGFGNLMFSRCALIHNTIYNQRTGLLTPGVTANDVGVWGYDLILAANYVSGGMTIGNSGVEAAIRIQSVIRAIIVDNRARCGFDGQGIKHTYRSHYGNDKYWMRRNMTEYGDGIYFQPRANADPIISNNYLGDHWVYDHLYYSTLKSAYALRNNVSLTNYYGALVATGNAAYFDPPTGSGPYWAWNGQTGDTIGTNTSNAYQAPPALSAWLAADGLPPGADH